MRHEIGASFGCPYSDNYYTSSVPVCKDGKIANFSRINLVIRWKMQKTQKKRSFFKKAIDFS
jgi:hypothetical protein